MTILVGILCQDGVVIGSDSSATFGAGPQPHLHTIEQSAKKTEVIGNCILLAGTGSVGLGQRFTEVTAKTHKQKDVRNCDAWQTAKAIAANAIQDFSSTHAQPGQFGAMVAFPASGKFHLFEFGLADMQPEKKTDRMWFTAMGSGQRIVDPFLGLLKGAFFRDSQPKLNEGIFAAVWALQHAIDLNTGGINGPIQLGVVAQKKDKSGSGAWLLTEEELSEHHQVVKDVTNHLAAYREKLSNVNAPAIPAVPAIVASDAAPSV